MQGFNGFIGPLKMRSHGKSELLQSSGKQHLETSNPRNARDSFNVPVYCCVFNYAWIGSLRLRSPAALPDSLLPKHLRLSFSFTTFDALSICSSAHKTDWLARASRRDQHGSNVDVFHRTIDFANC